MHSLSRALKLASNQFTDRTLPNGMRVTAQDHRFNSRYQVWYHVGSKMIRRSGLRISSNMMFRAAGRIRMMDRLTDGWINNLSRRTTLPFASAVRNYLRLLWAHRLAPRSMLTMQTQSSGMLQRRISACSRRPTFVFVIYCNRNLFRASRKRPGIGSIEDLDAASLKTSDFHATYYRPDICTLVAVVTSVGHNWYWIVKYFAQSQAGSTDTGIHRS